MAEVHERVRTPNPLLKRQRELRGWSQGQVALELQAHFPGIAVTARDVGRWKSGKRRPGPYYREKLCTLFQTTADKLGFIPQDISFALEVEGGKTDKQEEEPDTSSKALGERGEESVNRRDATRVLGAFGLQLFGSNPTHEDFLASPFSSASLHNLAIIIQQFREMHRRGDTFFWPGLRAHITTIQDILTSTTEESIRHDLWRLLAQTQLLMRLGYQPSPAKRHELAQGKTYNEFAIAYAQQSGDTALRGGAIGHLAQFYLRQEPDLAKATQYLNEAQPFARGNNVLMGWLSLLRASIDAKAGHAQQCEKDLAYAMDSAHVLSQSPEYSDVYYTDFSLVSAQAFCINCWLTIGNPQKAQACFAVMNLADLSENRQASAFYDASRLYAALGDLDLTQTYAFQAIDKAIKTHQLYVISRCRKLATTILEREVHEPHATAILEYAQII